MVVSSLSKEWNLENNFQAKANLWRQREKTNIYIKSNSLAQFLFLHFPSLVIEKDHVWMKAVFLTVPLGFLLPPLQWSRQPVFHIPLFPWKLLWCQKVSIISLLQHDAERVEVIFVNTPTPLLIRGNYEICTKGKWNCMFFFLRWKDIYLFGFIKGLSTWGNWLQ